MTERKTNPLTDRDENLVPTNYDRVGLYIALLGLAVSTKPVNLGKQCFNQGFNHERLHVLIRQVIMLHRLGSTQQFLLNTLRNMDCQEIAISMIETSMVALNRTKNYPSLAIKLLRRAGPYKSV